MRCKILDQHGLNFLTLTVVPDWSPQLCPVYNQRPQRARDADGAGVWSPLAQYE